MEPLSSTSKRLIMATLSLTVMSTPSSVLSTSLSSSASICPDPSASCFSKSSITSPSLELRRLRMRLQTVRMECRR